MSYLIELNEGNGHTAIFLCEKTKEQKLHCGLPVSDDYKVAVKFDDEASANSFFALLGVTEKDFRVCSFNEVFKKIQENRLAKIPEDMKMTCGRRMSDMGPWDREENLDYWEKRGEDLCCSFCGSMHPDKINEIADAIIHQNDFSKGLLEGTTKSYKIYVKRDHIKNAGEGGIKFYSHHGYMGSEGATKAWFNKLNKAIEACKPEFEKQIEEFRKKLHGDKLQ